MTMQAKKIKRATAIKIAFALTGVALVVCCACLVVYLLTYRSVTTVVVQRRYWRYTLAVQYDEESTRNECKDVTSCSGFGGDRSCETRTECETVRETQTRTRCRTETTGETLPPIRPDVPCRMYYDDYLSDRIAYVISYRVTESEKTGSAEFDLDIWDTLQPGAIVEITQTAWNHITQAKRIK
jgi:hypothetical protein